MTVRHSPNTPVTTYQNQVQLYYHWLVFCCGFIEVEANGVWSIVLSGTDGVINSGAPSTFVAPSGIFTAGHVGKFLAVRDATNPINTTIALITAYTSPTTVQLNAPVTNFTVSATGVSYRIVDPATPPGSGNYFVVQNPVTTNQPQWQAKITVRSAAPLVAGIQFAPIGGWSVTTSLWTLPVCTEVLMYTTIAQSFMLADPEQGWAFFWAEDVGGIGSNRKAAWFGSLSPFHAPRVSGAPSDVTFGAVFGDTIGAASDNISRNNTAPNISLGQTMNFDNTIIPIYWAQKRLLSGTDTNTLAGSTNPRSSEADDYDVVAFQRSANQAFRGRVPGVKLLSENLVNRTVINTSTTYVLDSGIGVSWNGKTPV